MRKKKNDLNKKARQKDATEDDKLEASEAIRMYNYVLKLQQLKHQEELTKAQEKAYRKDFWRTARDVTNGTFGEPNSGPTFNKSTADQHYKTNAKKLISSTTSIFFFFCDLSHV